MEQITTKSKSKTTFKVLAIIFTIIAFGVFLVCFSMALEVFTNYKEYIDPNNNNADPGLSIAFAIVFYIIFGAIDLPILGLGILFSALAKKRKSKVGLIFLIINIVMLVALVGMFIVIRILV